LEKSTAVSTLAAGKPKLSYLCRSCAGKRERAGGIVGQRVCRVRGKGKSSVEEEEERRD